MNLLLDIHRLHALKIHRWLSSATIYILAHVMVASFWFEPRKVRTNGTISLLVLAQSTHVREGMEMIAR